MKNKITIIILQVFLILGCDSEQKNQTSAKIEDAKTEVTQQAAVPVKQEIVETISTVVAEKPEVVAVEQKSTATRTGEQVYTKSCVGCHAAGVAKAPKLGDKVAWQPRIAKGIDALYGSALNGVPGTAMMIKGACVNCSDIEIKAAVDFMVAKVR